MSSIERLRGDIKDDVWEKITSKWDTDLFDLDLPALVVGTGNLPLIKELMNVSPFCIKSNMFRSAVQYEDVKDWMLCEMDYHPKREDLHAMVTVGGESIDSILLHYGAKSALYAARACGDSVSCKRIMSAAEDSSLFAGEILPAHPLLYECSSRSKDIGSLGHMVGLLTPELIETFTDLMNKNDKPFPFMDILLACMGETHFPSTFVSLHPKFVRTFLKFVFANLASSDIENPLENIKEIMANQRLARNIREMIYQYLFTFSEKDEIESTLKDVENVHILADMAAKYNNRWFFETTSIIPSPDHIIIATLSDNLTLARWMGSKM